MTSYLHNVDPEKILRLIHITLFNMTMFLVFFLGFCFNNMPVSGLPAPTLPALTSITNTTKRNNRGLSII